MCLGSNYMKIYEMDCIKNYNVIQPSYSYNLTKLKIESLNM